MKLEWQDNPILEDLSDEEPPIHWILEHFLPQGMLFALGGLAGTGKSYLCYTLALAIACGMSILGFNNTRGPLRVLYFDEENSFIDYRGYERLIWKALDMPPKRQIAEHFWGVHFELGGTRWYEVAAEWIQVFQPHIFFIDTTTPALGIEDENDNAEASRAIQRLRDLMAIPADHTATCVALKHAKREKQDGSLTLRGGKAWEGQVDSYGYLARAVGATPKSGWGATRLIGQKTRAHGLRGEIRIEPRLLANGGWLLERAESAPK